MIEAIEPLQPHYAWLALGLVLAIAEMAIPGVFLIWMAGAAVITGLVTWLIPLSVPLQVVSFAVLSLVAVFAGRKYLASHPVVPADPKMNHRGARAIGEIVVVTQAILHGSGRVRLGDTEWLARGNDAAVGTSLRVADVEGSILLVEPLRP